MSELLLIALGAALVNNFVLVQLLGVCPFIGGSRRVEGAIGMALAIGLVLTIGGRRLRSSSTATCCGPMSSSICACSHCSLVHRRRRERHRVR